VRAIGREALDHLLAEHHEIAIPVRVVIPPVEDPLDERAAGRRYVDAERVVDLPVAVTLLAEIGLGEQSLIVIGDRRSERISHRRVGEACELAVKHVGGQILKAAGI